MLSDFTISSIRFATFCLFVEAAVVIFKNREEALRQKNRESIIDELSQAKLHSGKNI